MRSIILRPCTQPAAVVQEAERQILLLINNTLRQFSQSYNAMPGFIIARR